MSWTRETMEALRAWLAPETWYKHHPLDDAKFYVFVASVWNDIHTIWDETTTRELMAKEARTLHPDCEHMVADVIEPRKDEGTHILDFLDTVASLLQIPGVVGAD